MKGNIAKYLSNYYFNKVVDIVNNESTHHYHHAFEIYYMQSGVCNYFIGNQSYRVTPGDVILIPGGTIHRTNYNGVAHSRLVINCSSEYIPVSVAERIDSVGHLYRNNAVIPQLDAIFAKIEEEYANADFLSADVMRCYTAELFFLILRNPNEHENDSDENNIVIRALKYIQDNYMNEVKLSAVAKILSVSAEHLSRVF